MNNNGNNKLNILHGADLQVRNRETNLGTYYHATLLTIEETIITNNIDIYIFTGDIFEYAEANDTERKIIYSHLSRLVEIPCLKEIVIIAGNHDLIKNKKQTEANKTTNAIEPFFSSVEHLSYEQLNKLRYFKTSGLYTSIVDSKLKYLAYSLEDTDGNYGKYCMTEGIWNEMNEIHKAEINNPELTVLGLYHDILLEYAVADKLPINTKKLNSLVQVDDFPMKHILAGDIHKKGTFTNIDENKYFYYPGSQAQRNYGEGSYITYPHSIIHAEPKTLILYSFVVADNKFQFDKYLNIPNQITYNTININTDVKIDYKIWLSSIINNISIPLNDGVLNIRLLLSSLYVTDEFEIKSYLLSLLSQHTSNISINIEIKYDKFIESSIITNTQSRLDELMNLNLVDGSNDGDGSFDMKNLDVDAIDGLMQSRIQNEFNNILLDNNKLISLFEILLEENKGDIDKLIRDTSGDSMTADTVTNLIKSIFSEQLHIANQTSKEARTITPVLIETNGFMRLGKSLVRLDYEGITRISGTNGIGKTTLYHMLYWVIRGVLFADMKKHQIQKNLMNIFNDKLSDNNTVIVRYSFICNDKFYVLTRNANRNWKQRATDEHKQSKRWKDYVENITHGIQLDVYSLPEDFELTTMLSQIKDKLISTINMYSGVEAESQLVNIFGDIPDTIMILNHNIINTMLKSKSEDLRELVLNYIGIDYIKTLETNLPQVKAQLVLDKPKVSKVQLMEQLKSLNDRIETYNKNLLLSQNDIDILQPELEQLKNELETTTNLLLKHGNIEVEINDLSQQKTNVDAKLLVMQNQIAENPKVIELLQLPELSPELAEPPKTSEKLKELYFDIETDTEWLVTHQKEIDKINHNIEIHKKDLIATIYTHIDDFKSSVDRTRTEIIDMIRVMHSTINENKQSKIKTLSSSINDSIEKLITEQSVYNTEKGNLLVEASRINIEITGLKTQLNNGVCVGCNREFVDFTKKKDEINNALLIAYNAKEKIAIRITDVTNKIEVIRTELRTLNDNLISVNHIPEIVELNNIAQNLLLYMQNIDNIELYSAIDAYPDLADSASIIKTKIREYSASQVSVKQFHAILSEVKDNDFHQLLQNKYVVDIMELTEKLHSVKLLLVESQNKLSVNNKLKDELQTEYNNSILIYHENLTEFNKSKELIIQHNANVNLFIQKMNELNQLNLVLSTKLTKLNTVLIEYNTLNQHRIALQAEHLEKENALNEATKKYNNDALIHQQLNSNLDSTKEQYNQYLLWQRDNIIYKYYEQLVKKDFKDIVFAYYRTYLNNTLSVILSGISFKLVWDSDGDLYMVELSDGMETYRPVKLVSGMQTCFLGLALIYTIHLLNIQNKISTIFIDEISGVLNDGKNLKQLEPDNTSNPIINYQEQLVKILSKFTDKSIFIVDHVIDNIGEATTIEVINNPEVVGTSKFIIK